MNQVEIFRLQAESAFKEVLTAIEGVNEPKAWAVLPQGDDDYLHSEGSIYSIVLHVATGKFIYGSVAFKGSEIRWRDCAARLDQFEPSWTSAIDYLIEAHSYWLASWADLLEADLDGEVPHFSGKPWPVWRILDTVIRHDSYHAGQITLLRYAVAESSKQPLSVAEDIRTHCSNLPSW